ncbi:MAG: sigma-54-dependent transcriptional regulator [Pleomorphochaeta sp.]
MHILLIDDNQQLFEVLQDNFSFVGHYLFYANNRKNALNMLSKETINLILLDVRLGEENGVEILPELKKMYENIPIIMITGYATVETAVKAMKLGAYDFVKKPIDFNTLCNRIDAATQNIKVKKENENLKERLKEGSPLFESKNIAFNNIITRAEKLAASDISILIIGENGCGKEILADYIYKNSNRISEKFIKINCAAFPEALLDNELFGHEKGAYTGAESDYIGVFEQADNGTLLLDEIGDMPTTLQAKILRVIQNQEVRRIGSKKTKKINVRFIAATNKDLFKMVEDNTFREDLFYRLNGGLLKIPALRNRKEDMDDLFNTLLFEISKNTKTPKKILSNEVKQIFFNYQWPGNIRELKNALLYAATISQDNEIQIEDLPPSFELYGTKSKESLSIIQQREKELIKKVLLRNNNNKTETAKFLKMSRNTLYLKIKKYGIVIDE